MDNGYFGIAFRVWCESPNQLAIQYIDSGIFPIDGFQMRLILDHDAPYAMETKSVTSYGEARQVLEGRILITTSLATSIATAQFVDIDAPTEMGQPTHTGSALPLKRIVEACH